MDNRIAVVGEDGKELILYEPQSHQQIFHESDATNLLALGTRGTGKSTTLRWDAIIRCLLFPGFKALIIRRKIPDLQKSHLRFISHECKMLGDDVAQYRETTHDVKFSNGSFMQFSHCEKMRDIENYLSSEWDYIGFDELSSFMLEMFLQISAACRSTTDKPYKGLVRACSNPLGPGAAWMKAWFVDKNVDLAEYPDYHPDDFIMQFSTLAENRYVNRQEYEKRLRVLPDHVRRAWLLGEFVIEGAYFTDFQRQKVEYLEKEGQEEVVRHAIPWHCINTMPLWRVEGHDHDLLGLPWIKIYRSVDWGYDPDPAVCHWHAVLPNGRKITFMERTWKRTLAKDVAQDIRQLSKGMAVAETFADPTMFIKTGLDPYSIAEKFEHNGVPLTPSQNDRILFGYSLHEMMNTLIDGLPSWQILEYACPELVKTIPLLQKDQTDARKVADGPDHWAVSCAYFAMGKTPASRDPVRPLIPRWMQSKKKPGNRATL